MVSFWWRPIWLFLVLSVFATLFGLGDEPATGWIVLSLGLLGYLVYNLRQLSKLSHWLDRAGERPLVGDGVWGDVLYRLEKRLRSGQGAQQKAVADLERMLEATRSLPDGVVILDSDGRIAWLNDAAERLLGLSPQRDVGQFIVYLLRHSRFNAWLNEEDYGQTLTMDSVVQPDKTLSLQLVPLPRQQKMLLASDISELSRVEAMRRDFVANVSHELRTPITVIVGFLEAFEDMPEPDPVEFRKRIPLMREQSDRIRRLVDDLLTLARLETEPESQEEAVDVVALTRRLADEARTMSHGQHEVNVQVDSELRLLANPQELYSALANLVSNAVRYTPQGGQVTLSWSVGPNGSGLFAVTDTGDGIEAQHIPRLTERFYRVDRGRSRATGGTGLGLAIVKHILQRHQARLRIESTVGKGSTFTAAFPADRLVPEQLSAVPESVA